MSKNRAVAWLASPIFQSPWAANDGYAILSNPRTMGDGYYESTVADPEGNCIEISE